MDGVRILDRHPNGSPRFVAGSLGNVGQLSADDATASLQLRERIVAPLALFDLVPGDLVFWRVTRDETGARHFRFKQVHEGLDVLGADLVVHVRANGELFAINGTAHGRFRWSKASRTLAVPDAVRLAARHAKVSGLNVAFVREVYFQSTEGVNYLALELDASPDGGPPVARVYVDATGDAVLAVHSLTRTARFRGVYDAHHHTDNSKLPGTLRRAEGDVPSADFEVNTLYDKLGDVHDAYLSIFGRDSYDDSGGTIHASVHYGANVCNAKFTHYWSWLPPWSYGRILVFGDGDGVGCLPLGRALDVVAHEFAHWASEHDVGLNGSGEPDAIDEGLADVFGAIVEAWVLGGRNGAFPLTRQNWLVAEDVVSPFRDMCDPAALGGADLWDPSIGAQDPHHGGNLVGLAACLMTSGGGHPRGKTPLLVTGIGFARMAQVFYRAQRDYLTSNATFAALRVATVQAAAQLGYDAQAQASVGCAWGAVGVGTVSGCAKSDILFTQSSGQVAIWRMNGALHSDVYPGIAGGSWSVQGAGDFNGDGKADILWRDGSGVLAMWFLDGATRTDGYPGTVGLEWAIRGVGDFDGGGLSDILWRSTDGTVAIWRMHGAVKIGEIYPASGTPGLALDNAWSIQGVGDLNTDGLSDIVWRHTSGTVRAWLMNRVGPPTMMNMGAAGNDWQIVGVADFGGDGVDDLLWRQTTGQVAIWHIVNGVVVSQTYPGSAGLEWQVAGAGDFDGNGKGDILWRSSTGVVAVWLDGNSAGALYPGAPGLDWTIRGVSRFD